MLNFAIVVDKPIRHSPLVVDKPHSWVKNRELL